MFASPSTLLPTLAAAQMLFTALAADPGNDPRALQGVGAVLVFPSAEKLLSIEQTVDGINPTGLHFEDISTAVDLRLSNAGVPVVVFKDIIHRYYPKLVVEINVLRLPGNGETSQLSVFYVRLKLVEHVTLPRLLDRPLTSTTWEAAYWGSSPSQELGAAVKDKLERLADRFAHDYLAANPKEPRRPEVSGKRRRKRDQD